jgi:hypothetical protein
MSVYKKKFFLPFVNGIYEYEHGPYPTSFIINMENCEPSNYIDNRNLYENKSKDKNLTVAGAPFILYKVNKFLEHLKYHGWEEISCHELDKLENAYSKIDKIQDEQEREHQRTELMRKKTIDFSFITLPSWLKESDINEYNKLEESAKRFLKNSKISYLLDIPNKKDIENKEKYYMMIKEKNRGENLKFIPTYEQVNSININEILKNMLTKNINAVLLKDVTGSVGEGIYGYYLTRDTFNNVLANITSKLHETQNTNYILQQYIDSVKLVDVENQYHNTKLRVYVVPIYEIYEGAEYRYFWRFPMLDIDVTEPVPHSLEDIMKNQKYYISNLSAEYSQSIDSQLMTNNNTNLNNFFRERIYELHNLDSKELDKKINEVCKIAVEAYDKKCMFINDFGYERNRKCFAIHALDMIVDTNGEVYLLEINTGPAIQKYEQEFYEQLYNVVFQDMTSNDFVIGKTPDKQRPDKQMSGGSFNDYRKKYMMKYKMYKKEYLKLKKLNF